MGMEIWQARKEARAACLNAARQAGFQTTMMCGRSAEQHSGYYARFISTQCNTG